MVYATNCSRLIFSLQLTTFPKEVVWKITPGDAKHIAVRADGKLFVVASDGQLWTRSSRSSEWKHYESPKPLLQIYPAVGGAAWAVDESNRVLFKPQFANRDGWEQVIGPEMLSLSVSADGNHVWGVTTDGCLCCRNCGSGAAGPGTCWEFPYGDHTAQVKLKQVSVSRDGDFLWAVGANAELYSIFWMKDLSLEGQFHPFQPCSTEFECHQVCDAGGDGSCWIVTEGRRLALWHPELDGGHLDVPAHSFGSSPYAWTFVKSIVINNRQHAKPPPTNERLCPLDCSWDM